MLHRKIVKKIFGKSQVYRFIAWLHGGYSSHCTMQYTPEQFRYFGEGATISPNVKISKPERVIIKENSHIATGTMINSKGGLYIGSNSGIGFNNVIWTTNHNYRKSKTIPFDNISNLMPVIIRDFVWIGANVKILPGVEINEGAIVGLGAVVNRSVPPYAIVSGNPCKIIGHRSKEHFEECKINSLTFPIISSNGYEERILPFYKRKYKAELQELGMFDL